MDFIISHEFSLENKGDFKFKRSNDSYLTTVSLPLNTELQSLYQMAEKDMIPPDYDIRKILENLLYQLKEKGILTPDNVKNTIDEGKLIPS
jgi:hypothetical protein